MFRRKVLSIIVAGMLLVSSVSLQVFGVTSEGFDDIETEDYAVEVTDEIKEVESLSQTVDADLDEIFDSDEEYEVEEIVDDKVQEVFLEDPVGMAGDTGVLELITTPLLHEDGTVRAKIGQTVTLLVSTSAEVSSWQWQYSSNGTTWKNCASAGYNTEQFSFIMKATLIGRRYRCLVTVSGESAEPTDTITMQEAVAPEIIAQPQSVQAAVGEAVTLSVAAEDDDLSYQWQYSSNKGKTWKNCSAVGYNTDTFSFKMKETINGRLYRCVLTNADDCSTISDVAVVTLKEGLEIVSQPQSITVKAGDQARFVIGVNSDDVTYQWQYSSNGKTWKNCTIAGNATDTIAFVMKASYNNRQYRCIVDDGIDNLISDVAVLTLDQTVELAITEQPVSMEAAAGEGVHFTVGVIGESVTYQWQYSSNGTSWKNCSVTGYNTDTISFTMKAGYNNRRYRCLVSDGMTTLTSDEAVVTFYQGPSIIEQPETSKANPGEQAVFYVVAEGRDLTYQWQYSSNGTTWKNCSVTGYNTDSISFTMKASYDGRQYRCIVKDAYNNEEISGTAAVLLKGPRIITQPGSVSAFVGELVSLSIEAEGDGLTYQWQYSSNNGKTWKNCSSTGYNTDVFGFTMKNTINGRQYRCIVTDLEGIEKVSDVATVTLAYIEIDGVIYENLNGVMTVTDYIGNASSVTVQEVVHDMTVTVIGASSFEGNTTITEIDLPDTIEVIETRAFAGCSNLNQMN